MRIALTTPAHRSSRAGNWHTAQRWAAFLRAAGHRVTVSQEWNADADTDLLLALHARRSHSSIKAFAGKHPDRPRVLALTGTDVYRDIRTSAAARESLELANRFIVLQPRAIDELAPCLRSKARVVIQSSSTALRHHPVQRGFRVCVIGHLREEKDPLCALRALAELPRGHSIEVVQLGDVIDAALAKHAQAAMRREPRYRWLGGLPHHRALRWLASSHAMVISSRMEGGANVVSEAIRVGVPVIGSRIPGNTGLLGESYPALYPVGDARALACLMRHASEDGAFYAKLKRHIGRLRPLVDPAREAHALRRALAI